MDLDHACHVLATARDFFGLCFTDEHNPTPLGEALDLVLCAAREKVDFVGSGSATSVYGTPADQVSAPIQEAPLPGQTPTTAPSMPLPGQASAPTPGMPLPGQTPTTGPSMPLPGQASAPTPSMPLPVQAPTPTQEAPQQLTPARNDLVDAVARVNQYIGDGGAAVQNLMTQFGISNLINLPAATVPTFIDHLKALVPEEVAAQLL